MARNYWDDYQEGKIEKARQTELIINYENELALKDVQLEVQEESLRVKAEEVVWARRHVAQREEQIALLREGFDDETNICFDMLIDPVLAP